MPAHGAVKASTPRMLPAMLTNKPGCAPAGQSRPHQLPKGMVVQATGKDDDQDGLHGEMEGDVACCLFVDAIVPSRRRLISGLMTWTAVNKKAVNARRRWLARPLAGRRSARAMPMPSPRKRRSGPGLLKNATR